MQAKAEEQKKLLQHYEEKSYLYGREAQDLISHTGGLVRKYGETAQENRKEAALHQQMALEEMKDSTANSSKWLAPLLWKRRAIEWGFLI
jgi:hypothetical protein